jgi:hypothetical protein
MTRHAKPVILLALVALGLVACRPRNSLYLEDERSPSEHVKHDGKASHGLGGRPQSRP